MTGASSYSLLPAHPSSGVSLIAHLRREPFDNRHAIEGLRETAIVDRLLRRLGGAIGNGRDHIVQQCESVRHERSWPS
jgi:hypothetical protein